MLLYIFILIAIPAIGGWYLTRGKSRSIGKLQNQVVDDVRKRLEAIAAKVGGSVTDEPSLETPAGRLTLFASKAPESFVIDTAKFVAPLATTLQLTIVRVEDAKKVVSTKGLIPLKSAEPQDQQTHLFFASVEAFGRRCMEPAFVDLLRALDRGVKGRCRVLLAKGSLTILLARGLAKPEELEAFYAGCQEVVAGVAVRSGAAAA